MSRTDDRIRAAMGAVADRAPLPPDIEAIGRMTSTPVRPGRRVVVLAGVVAAVALLAFAAVRAGNDDRPVASGGTTHLAPRDVPADLRLTDATEADDGRYSSTSLTYTVGARPFDEGHRALTMVVTAVPDGDVERMKDHPSPLAERLDVRGHEAELFEDDPAIIAVVWIEDSLAVSVSGFHLSREAVLRAAESLEPLSDDEWEAVRAEAAAGSLHAQSRQR